MKKNVMEGATICIYCPESKCFHKTEHVCFQPLPPYLNADAVYAPTKISRMILECELCHLLCFAKCVSRNSKQQTRPLMLSTWHNHCGFALSHWKTTEQLITNYDTKHLLKLPPPKKVSYSLDQAPGLCQLHPLFLIYIHFSSKKVDAKMFKINGSKNNRKATCDSEVLLSLCTSKKEKKNLQKIKFQF